MFEVRTIYDAENKIWHGPIIQNPFNDNLSVGQAILIALKLNPNKVTQISHNNGIEITCEEMRLMSIRACQHFLNKGLEQTDIIGIAANNSHHLAPIVFGSLLCGTAISTLDPTFGTQEIKHIYKLTKPKIIFCDPINYEAMMESVKELNLTCEVYLMKGNIEGVKTVDEFLKPTDMENQFIPPQLKNGGDQTAVILCSSGTTGLPKGVCLSHKMVLRQSTFMYLNETDVIMCFSSLYWLSGLYMLVLGTLNNVLRIIHDQPFTTKLFFDITETYRVTSLLMPPSQLALITQDPDIHIRNLSSIRMLACGGSAVPDVLKVKMEKYLPNGMVGVAYGMTEVGGCLCIESFHYRRLDTAGQMVVNTEAKIIDFNGKSLGIDEQGEILLRADCKWPGYYGNEIATAALCDKDQWIHSGDLGYFDKDGYLHIVDRLKDILKYKNFHFFPNEIEQTILELPDVVEVSVCGLPDLVYTDLPTAVVVKKIGSKLCEKDVYEHVEKRLADFKKLRGGVYFVDDLPKTASGKIQRNKVKELVQKLSAITINGK